MNHGKLSSATSGFTIIEAIIGLVLGTVLVAAIFALAQVTQKQKQMTRQETNLLSSGSNISALVRTDVEKAGKGLLAAPNLSGIHVDTATVSREASDTLTVLRGEGLVWRNSAYQCQSGSSNCVALMALATDSIQVNDLLVIGNAKTGAKIVQVADVSDPYTANCGADCGQERFSCSEPIVGTIEDDTLTSSTTTSADGTSTTLSDDPCTQPHYEDGSSCSESYTLVDVGDETSTSCSVGSSTTRSYVDVTYTDRTGTFGYPDLASFTQVSGVEGVPAVRTRQVRFVRYFLDRSNPDHPTLMKQVEMKSDGTFAAGQPVASDIMSFRVQVQHQDTTSLVRGTGVPPADLVMDESTNPNYEQNLAPDGDGLAPGFKFKQSYRTIGAVRLTFSVLTRQKFAGSEQDQRRRVETSSLVSTTNLLEGGVGFMPQP